MGSLCTLHSGMRRIFLGRGAVFQKNFEKFAALFFLGRPNWFSELSKILQGSYYLKNFLRRR